MVTEVGTYQSQQDYSGTENVSGKMYGICLKSLTVIALCNLEEHPGTTDVHGHGGQDDKIAPYGYAYSRIT